MKCRLCQWLSNWLGTGKESICASTWRELYAWEQEQSNDWELWAADLDRNRELSERAQHIKEHDVSGAFQLYLEAAEGGSAWAMEIVALYYKTGTGVPVDLERAEAFLHRAIRAGSWSATLEYAKLAASTGDTARCERVLQDGVEANFVPAFFWLAWYRYRWSPSAETCREIRPILERADALGHPLAGRMLAALMMRGKYGIREVPRGWKLLWAGPDRFPAILGEGAAKRLRHEAQGA